MHGPSAMTVQVPVSGFDAPIAGALSAMVCASIAGLWACGALQSAGSGLWAVGVLASSLILTMYLVRCARTVRAVAVLRWDGQNWFWSCGPDDASCMAKCVMDLQRWMLLQVQLPDGSREWLWLRRKALAKNWYPLRRALIFSAITAHDRAVNGPWGQRY